MKRMLMACLLPLGIAAMSNTQNAGARPAACQSFKAGGTSIAIPPPTTGMTEVGYDNRELMEVFVAPNNRLIGGLVKRCVKDFRRRASCSTCSSTPS
jgi:hypothetical protein